MKRTTAIVPLLLGAIAGAPSTSFAVSEVFDHLYLYEDDVGSAFAQRQNGYSYGWSSDNTANAYDRNSKQVLDERYDRGVAMGEKSWEVEVRNGTYTVLVVAGEPEFLDANYRIMVEGKLAVDGIPKAEYPFVSGLVTVEVSDGRLTVSSASGSKNNRLAYLHITSPLHGHYPTKKYATLPLRIDVGNLGGFPFRIDPGFVHDKMWVENSDYGYFSPTNSMAKVATGMTFSSTSLSTVYTTYLMGTFGYRIRVENGKYRMKLKFAEFRSTGTGRDNADILVNGATVIPNLDIIKMVGPAKPFDTTLAVNVSGEMIELGFKYLGQWVSPLLNGIELLPYSLSAGAEARRPTMVFSANRRMVSFPGARRGDKLRILSLDGRSMVSMSLSPGQSSSELPSLGKGMYVVRYEDIDGMALMRSRHVAFRE